MTRFTIFLSCILFICISAQSQSIKGKLLDLIDNTPLSGASLKLLKVSDTMVKYNTTSDSKGVFEFRDISADSFSFEMSYIGYANYKQYVTVSDSIPDIDLGTLFIPKQTKQLSEVKVTAKTPPAQQKGDTIQYNASQFKVNPDASAEDLIKKMPGVTVEKGQVTAQGEQVRKVTVDGREFFGDDATATLRNLPAEIIDKIQVFDRLSDQAQFTGFDDGNTAKAINIVTKSNMRNGQFGRVFVGYGTDNRYSVGGNVSFFNGTRRVSLVGLVNNINQQNFSAQDLLGVTSTGNRGGFGGGNFRGGGGGFQRGSGAGGGNFRGGGGAGGFGGFGSSNNFLVGQQSGISKTNAFGINFSDVWSKKIEVTGSYFFNNSNNTNNELSKREYFLTADSSLFYSEDSRSKSTNYNHRLNMRIEYKIDSSNSIMITPNLNFQNNKSINNIAGVTSYSPINLLSESNNQTNSSTSGYNISNNILYQHSFTKKGRTVSLNFNTSLNRRDGKTFLQAFNRYYDGFVSDDSLQQFMDQFNNGYQISANIAYTEPIGKNGQLQMNYYPSYSKSKADQETFQYDIAGQKYSLFDTALSNKYENTYTTQTGGISYRFGNRNNNMFSVGLNYQFSELDGDQGFPYLSRIDRAFSNFLPNAMLRLKLSSKSNIRFQYRGSTNPPSVTQLQDVINNTNPLLLTTGNINLKQQYTNSLITRYSFTNTQKSQTFFANIFLQNNSNYIANATYIASKDSILNSSVVLKRGAQLTKPVNMNGFWSLRSFFTFGLPLKFIKSNLNMNGGFSYSKLPGLINYTPNISNSYNYNIGTVLASNVSQYVDFTFSYSANINVVKNSIQPELNNNYFTHLGGFQMNLLSKKGWFFQNDLTNQLYYGLTGGFDQNYWLWNISAGKKFMKDQNGELKLSVFDLLKQNRSINRTVTETYIEDIRSEVLRQYAMLTFTYKLRNFGSSKRGSVKK